MRSRTFATIMRILLLLVVTASMLPAIGRGQGVSIGLTTYGQSIAFSGDTPDDRALTSALGYGFGLSAAWSVSSDVDITLAPSFDVRRNDISNVLPRTDSLELVGSLSQSTYVLPLGVRVYAASRTWCFTSGVMVRFENRVELEALDTDTTFTVNNGFEDVELGVFLGVGYRFSAGAIDILPEIRYEQGLSNVLDDVEIPALPPAPVMRANGFSIRLTAEYVLGGRQ
jgi:hypothetical protein